MEKIEKLEENEEALKTKMKSLGDEKRVLEKDFEKMKKEAESMSQNLTNLEGAVPFVKSARGSKNRFDAIEKRLKALKDQYSRVENAPDYEQLGQELKSLKEKRSKTQSQIDRLERERRQVEQAAAKMSDKRERLRSELAKLQADQVIQTKFSTTVITTNFRASQILAYRSVSSNWKQKLKQLKKIFYRKFESKLKLSLKIYRPFKTIDKQYAMIRKLSRRN